MKEQPAWSIDAARSLQSVLEHPDCPPPLRRALTGVLSWQMRSRTPVQRTLSAPRLAPQWIATLLALGATVTTESGTMSLETFLVHRETAGVTALHIPTGRDGQRWGEARVVRTPADEPIVAAIAVIEMEGGLVTQARIALTGVWPEPARLAQASAQLVGSPLDENRIRSVASAVEKEVAPKGDFLGSEEYRRAMAGVLTRRALEQCLEDVRGRGDAGTRRRGDAGTRGRGDAETRGRGDAGVGR